MRLCILIILLTSTIESKSQIYVPFPDSNAVWCGRREQLYFNPPDDQWHKWTYQQYISGDTTINGLNYHKVEENGLFEWEAYPIPTSSGSSQYFHQYVGSFRESNKVIYFISAIGTNENYLYDFNINVGDTLPSNFLTNSNTTMITRIDSILISGNYRRQYFVSVIDTNMWQLPTHFEYVSIIEGVGSTNGLKWTIMPYFERAGSLWALKQDGLLIYTDSIATGCDVTSIEEIGTPLGHTKLYPNPCENYIFVETDSFVNISEITVYSLEGKEILKKRVNTKNCVLDISITTKGIYFLKVVYSSGNIAFFKTIKN